jgi:SAM-dependent methyltransferase
MPAQDQRAKLVPYILGHSESEIRRLMLQSVVLRPVTGRLLREAGIAPGMRVLDLGCGTGDVAMLAADLMGSNGTVVGVDSSAEVLDVARERARIGGYSNVEYRQARVEDFQDPRSFDFAIGRYVLIHQAEPAAFIRSVASHVHPGGIIAFHEVGIFGECPMSPLIPVWSQAWNWIIAAFHSVMAHPDAAGRMTAHFEDAGLKSPKVFCEMPTDSGPDSLIYAWGALSVRSLLPQIEKIGAATAEEVDIDTLEDRLRETALAARSQLPGFLQYCGWVTR